MRYPVYNPTKVDTGLRTITIASLYGKEAEKYNCSSIVTSGIIVRRLDAISAEGDEHVPNMDNITTPDLDNYTILYKGTEEECVNYLSALSIDGKVLIRHKYHIIYTDNTALQNYIDTVSTLCDDGATLCNDLNNDHVDRLHRFLVSAQNITKK